MWFVPYSALYAFNRSISREVICSATLTARGVIVIYSVVRLQIVGVRVVVFTAQFPRGEICVSAVVAVNVVSAAYFSIKAEFYAVGVRGFPIERIDFVLDCIYAVTADGERVNFDRFFLIVAHGAFESNSVDRQFVCAAAYLTRLSESLTLGAFYKIKHVADPHGARGFKTYLDRVRLFGLVVAVVHFAPP